MTLSRVEVILLATGLGLIVMALYDLFENFLGLHFYIMPATMLTVGILLVLVAIPLNKKVEEAK